MNRLILAAPLFALVAACSDNAEAPAANATTAAATATPAAPTATTTAAATPAAVLDPNTATAEQLAAIAGMTPEAAAAIVAGRPYADAAAFAAKLRETLPAAAETVGARVFVPVNLNTASEEAIEQIPGMTPKMVHEFLEYRPYENMAEFDREIGKYVDEAEVARLRSYVTL